MVVVFFNSQAQKKLDAERGRFARSIAIRLAARRTVCGERRNRVNAVDYRLLEPAFRARLGAGKRAGMGLRSGQVFYR